MSMRYNYLFARLVLVEQYRKQLNDDHPGKTKIERKRRELYELCRELALTPSVIEKLGIDRVAAALKERSSGLCLEIKALLRSQNG